MDVINHAGNTGTVISESVPNLVRRACAARNRVAHPNPRGADGWEYYVLYKALRWILRHCLLLELGYSQEEASERVRRCMAFDRESRTIVASGGCSPTADSGTLLRRSAAVRRSNDRCAIGLVRTSAERAFGAISSAAFNCACGFGVALAAGQGVLRG